MNTSASDADEPTQPAPDEADEMNPWMVRFFLVLAFGLAFGIEGMTLVRSYLIDGDEEETEEAVEARTDEAPLGLGDDVLPTTPVAERVTQLRIQARSDGPWVFQLAVTVVNDRGGPYRLTLRDLEVDDGSTFDDASSVACAPGDSTRLVVTWPIGANARPSALTAEAEFRGATDSTRTVRRRVSFGHVPVRMEQ